MTDLLHSELSHDVAHLLSHSRRELTLEEEHGLALTDHSANVCFHDASSIDDIDQLG